MKLLSELKDQNIDFMTKANNYEKEKCGQTLSHSLTSNRIHI